MIWDNHSDHDNTHLVHWNPAVESASVTVVRATASLSGRRQSQLTPLYEVVSPEALNDVFSERRPESEVPDLTIQFHYEGFDVMVTNGRILLRNDEQNRQPC